jgi:hypothetical protein
MAGHFATGHYKGPDTLQTLVLYDGQTLTHADWVKEHNVILFAAATVLS